MKDVMEMKITWRGAADLLATALESGTYEGKRNARIELYRMAEMADKWAEHERRIADDARLGNIAPHKWNERGV